jgi:predicted amidohydrolase YtcJ
VTRETVPPTGGVVVKDAAGEPTGVLLEGAAGALYRVLPPPGEADQAAAIGVAIEGMHREGITSFTEPGIDAATLGRYAARARAGGLGARLTVLLRGGPSVESVQAVLDLDRSRAGIDPRWLRVAGGKLFADGIPTINKTAWLHEPFVGGGHGSLSIGGGSDEERVAALGEMIARVHAAGLQIGTHATGDRAIDAVVDGYVRAMASRPRDDARHYLIHADLTSPATLRRMAAHGIGANFNAGIKHMIVDGQVEAIGPARAGYEWPYRTALDAGVRVASSSDAPVTYPNWRQGVATCLLRKGRQSGKVFGPEQRIDLMEALRTYTTGGAWQDRAESWKGSVEVGRAADLCVVDGPLIGRDPEELAETGVAMTVVAGRVVHRSG